ncbi:hypothetical protein PRZ48_012879 [Zasmidium cellare]|uniref:Uncharacterized protein n=1 Tax=Zasmidium cellare TaxID=395010 RepID=A0ABR0E322_ZASCE|nr:hypothetical protein PRZ48_012879 [Zasmidium cellare]
MVDGDLRLAHGPGKGAKVKWPEVDSMRDSMGNVVFPQLARYPNQDHGRDVEKVKRRSKEILQHLSCMIDMDFANLPPDVRGYSKAVEGPLSPELMAHWPRGIRSQIFIAAERYFEMLKLTTRQRQGLLSNKELERLLLAQFSYAMTLVHEVGHALHCAVQGSIHRGEPFFGDCEIAEGGYDLEAAIFGGLLDGNITMTTRQYAKNAGLCGQAKDRVRRGQYVKNALTLTKWPSGIYQHSYRAGHSIMESRKELSLVDEVSRVPLSFIEDLFSKLFWGCTLPHSSLGPLPVPTIGKWLISADAETERQFVCNIDDLSTDQASKSRLRSMVSAERQGRSSVKLSTPHEASPQKTSKKVWIMAPQSVVSPDHLRALRSRRLVAIFGNELRRVAWSERSKEPSTTSLEKIRISHIARAPELPLATLAN